MFQPITAWFRASSNRLIAQVNGQNDDDVALARGWEIEHGRFGRRIYRDPRFAALPAAREPAPADVPVVPDAPLALPIARPFVPAQRTAELVPSDGSP
jgi:hypothetical protein